MQVLYGLEYTYAIPHIREKLVKSARSCGPKSRGDIHFADVMCLTLGPFEDHRNSKGLLGILGGYTSSDSSVAEAGTRYSIGGLIWDIPEGCKMEVYLLFWIGLENSAFANIMLTLNGCEIGKYNTKNACKVEIHVHAYTDTHVYTK
ncbi:hypothetical protein SLEP1_g50598 [Rubroshorea leprosula]|uniref:Uncharacterized protein n=1 Tax=Rubroshorea leprosula TaxID=152421 RepID=A0AAV5M336_9ROSI|nr:hypothetical protein SLEP1_g50598 [Rubroshorea leprosula]